MTYNETDIVASIERLVARDVGRLTPTQLDALDQFHAGGADAIRRMIPGLHLGAGKTALDVGCGLGGPARQVARATGARVVGVDITPAYVDAAVALTAAAGLAGEVEHHCVDLADVTRDDFDAAYVVHVQMNVRDKSTFFREIARTLRPGGRLAVFEVCQAGPDDPALPLPLPWSIDGTDSFLVDPPTLLGCITDSGFEMTEWADETAWVSRWFEQLGSQVSGPQPAATLPAVLADGFARMINFADALDKGLLAVRRGTFVHKA